jgi:hypothetical protein
MNVHAVAFELPRAPLVNEELGDLRFRALVTHEEWAELPLAVRRRFSKRLAAGESIVYVGEVLEIQLSRAGWWLAQLLRLIGAPLPTARRGHVPSVVTVTEDRTTGEQIWMHICGRRSGFPQVIYSAKRFAGPTGLEEHVGYGIGMTLTVEVREAALIFRSKDYFFEMFGRRLLLPKWLCPGTMHVTHAELPDGKFAFTLQVIHPRFGLLIREMAIFRDLRP